MKRAAGASIVAHQWILLLAVVMSGPARAETITGRASVIDGDTIEIRGERIRLFGVDAPESGQPCFDRRRRRYRCGQVAAMALSGKIGSANVSCEKRDTDRFGRMVAVCSARGEDLSAWMVLEGLAVAYREYSQDYVAFEERARRGQRGLWAGQFVPPSDWRRNER